MSDARRAAREAIESLNLPEGILQPTWEILYRVADIVWQKAHEDNKHQQS